MSELKDSLPSKKRICPLCQQHNNPTLSTANQKIYYQCLTCHLIHMDARFYLSPEDEKARYQTHENNPEDEGYQNFLQPAFDVLQTKLPANSKGLDFGCGEGSPLQTMFEKRGHTLHQYDVFFYPDTSVLNQSYDFIVSTETFEHLHYPKDVFEKLINILKPGGYLLIMTLFFKDAKSFEQSYYHRDPTHVVFFSEPTFTYMAKNYALKVSFPEANIALFEKPSAAF